jgi:hypothetical protein
MTARLIAPAVVVALAALSGAACHPLGLEGDSCEKGPCAAGLTCVDGVCKDVPPPPEPPPPCESAEDCSLNGSADGRECVDGVCGFAACFVDAQCGLRICDNGQCAERVLCVTNDGCEEGQVCDGNACRTACRSDADCPSVGQLALAQCIEGECVQRCLADLMCPGGICVDNLCAPPECNVDEDCVDAGPGLYFCNDTRRCEQYTPCDVAEDCFDPNFLCNDLGRCEERAACRVDADCGAGLCLDNHCRDAVGCDDVTPCGDGDECVAGRCVDAPACRSDDDCGGANVCIRGACASPPPEGPVAVVVARTFAGTCDDGCHFVALEGETLHVSVMAYDDTGLPVGATLQLTGDAAIPVDAGDGFDVTCGAPGTSSLTLKAFSGGALVREVFWALTCLDRTPGDLQVIVVDPDTGAPSSATVFVDEAQVGTTTNGTLDVAVFTGGAVGARTADGRGVVVLDAEPGVLWLPLPSAAGAPSSAAGFRAIINGTGDELGDVGVALALPLAPRARDASLDALLGPPFSATVQAPLIGALPVFLPAGAIMDATLPVVGAQEVKSTAFLTAPAGPGAFLAYEGRFDQQVLFNAALGASPIETALDFVAQTEGMDGLVTGAGLLEERPLVVDGDLADGIEDVDGDGDTAELVPDWGSFPAADVTPEVSLIERVGVVVSAPPQGANARAFAVCGVDLSAGFLPLGVAAVFGTDDGSGGLGEQLKVAPVPAAAHASPRACAVHAIFDDGSRSSAVVRAEGFAASLQAGALLDVPGDALVLEDVPAPGSSSVILPTVANADALSFVVFDGSVSWTVVTRARGTAPLPSWLDPLVVAQVSALRLGRSPAEALSTPATRIDDVAIAVSSGP